jgi:ABC-type glutathione transport system ATPase component
MNQCSVCQQSFSSRDVTLRYQRYVHGSDDTVKSDSLSQQITHRDNSEKMNFQHPFSMVVSGPSGSGKTELTKTLLLYDLVNPPPERIIWCYGPWQSLYDELQRRILWIEFVRGIPDYLNSQEYINTGKGNLIVFDDLMSEAKCDQRIAYLFTKGSHHRNISIIYLNQNLFPQGKACRDI